MKKVAFFILLIGKLLFSVNASAQIDFDIEQINNALKTELNFQTLHNKQTKKTRGVINNANRSIGTIEDAEIRLFIKKYKTEEEAMKRIQNTLRYLTVGYTSKNKFADESYTFDNTVNNTATVYLRKENIYVYLRTENPDLLVPLVNLVVKRLSVK